MYFPLKMRIFHCYVSLPVGTFLGTPRIPRNQPFIFHASSLLNARADARSQVVVRFLKFFRWFQGDLGGVKSQPMINRCVMENVFFLHISISLDISLYLSRYLCIQTILYQCICIYLHLYEKHVIDIIYNTLRVHYIYTYIYTIYTHFYLHGIFTYQRYIQYTYIYIFTFFYMF